MNKFLYCVLICLKLEYGSSVWSPCTIKHHAHIENVQQRATKFILNYPARKYPFHVGNKFNLSLEQPKTDFSFYKT